MDLRGSVWTRWNWVGPGGSGWIWGDLGGSEWMWVDLGASRWICVDLGGSWVFCVCVVLCNEYQQDPSSCFALPVQVSCPVACTGTGAVVKVS